MKIMVDATAGEYCEIVKDAAGEGRADMMHAVARFPLHENVHVKIPTVQQYHRWLLTWKQ